MTRSFRVKHAVSALLALLAAGCSTFGGNVKGNFACRAPDGSCAPTSVIDAEVTREAGNLSASVIASRAGSDASPRRLQIVIASYRDAQGRDHEPRIVHVAIADSPAKDWRAPLGTGDVLRALGAGLDEGSAAPSTNAEISNPLSPLSTLHLPDRLFIPSQPGSVLPGAHAPVTGASDRNASPDRVPHLADPANAAHPEREER